MASDKLTDNDKRALRMMVNHRAGDPYRPAGEVTGSNGFSAVSIPHVVGRRLQRLGFATWVFIPYGRDRYRITDAGRAALDG